MPEQQAINPFDCPLFGYGITGMQPKTATDPKRGKTGGKDMLKYMLRRILQMIPVLLIITIITFLFVNLSGDPTAMLLPPEATEEDRQVYAKAKEIFDKMALVNCTKCAYCMPCPFGLNIPELFAAYNMTASDGMAKAKEAYGALAEGRAVCFGYVYTMQFLCERAGLYCKAIEGTANWNDEDHGWNLAMLPEGSYYMDITWCDQYGPIGSVEWREMFMVTEYRMRGDHGNWEGGPATGEEQYWSWKNT